MPFLAVLDVYIIETACYLSLSLYPYTHTHTHTHTKQNVTRKDKISISQVCIIICMEIRFIPRMHFKTLPLPFEVRVCVCVCVWEWVTISSSQGSFLPRD